ncbi:MAG: FkbM family methyltransferase [Verrucomicrobiota bacterium]
MPYYPNTRVKYAHYIANLGWGGFLRYWLKRRSHKSLRHPFTLRSPGAQHPLTCRPRTSDIAVFKQIFAQREYACLDHLPTAGPGLIIDCGANAGFSSSYLLSRFPEASLVAIEPDPGNFAALQANVAPYGSRCSCLHAALWSHRDRLCLSTSAGDGLEWSRTVGEASGENADGLIEALDMKTLLAQSGHERVRLLKIDIEGAEQTVFSAAADWLAKIDTIVIELHGEACEQTFRAAVEPAGFQLRRHMELTIAERPAQAR